MLIAWSALWLLSWLKRAEPVCSPTSYYKDCWIRRFPGLYIAVEESQRRGAALLQLYQEESALKCSRACCLSSNFSCNLAVFHYNTTQDSANCFHLHCPTLESCILRQRGNVILYNVTKGVDPDLLVFGNHFTSNFQVLPNQALSRLNVSEPFASDKRQFNRPHVVPSSSTHPATPASSTSTPTTSLTSDVPDSTLPVSVQSTQDTPPASSVHRSTLKAPTQASSTHVLANLSPHTATTTTTVSTRSITTAPTSSTQSSSIFFNSRSTLPLQPASTATTSASSFSNQPRSGSTYQSTAQPTFPVVTTWASTTASVATDTRQTSTTASVTSDTTQTTTTALMSNEGTWASTTASMTSENTQASTTASTTNEAAWASTTASISSENTQASTAASTTNEAAWASKTASIFSSKHTTTTTSIPLISTQQSTSEDTSAHSTLVTAQLNSRKTTLASTLLLTTVKTIIQNHRTPTTQPQTVMTTSQETKTKRPYSQPTNPLSPDSPLTEESTTQSPTRDGQPQVYTSNSVATTEDSTMSTRLHSEAAGSVTTSLTPPTSVEDSQPYPNDTKGYISRNITTGDSPRPGGDEGLMPAWHLAANTVLVALATCATIAFGCCCSVLMAVSWRGRRRRKGRYRTTLTGKRGSMRLIKYVIVRESS